jgi:hypothetical protein
MPLKAMPELTLSNSAMSILEAAQDAGQLTLAGSIEELLELAAPARQTQRRRRIRRRI